MSHFLSSSSHRHLEALAGRAILELNLLDGLLGHVVLALAVAAHVREVDARVEEGQQERGDKDERAVEDEEAGLILHDSVAPAAGHFRDTAFD